MHTFSIKHIVLAQSNSDNFIYTAMYKNIGIWLMIDYHRHKTAIFGIQESGKTYFAQHEYKQFKKPIVFVVNKDDKWHKLPRLYVYEADRNNIQEDFKKFIKWAHKLALEGKIDLLIIDEADLFIRTNWDIEPELQDLILNHRHMNDGKGCALWFITRRPQDIPTKFVESCKYLVIFKLEGKNAVERFGEIHPDIPELIGQLDFQKHNYVVKEIGKPPEIHDALKPSSQHREHG